MASNNPTVASDKLPIKARDSTAPNGVASATAIAIFTAVFRAKEARYWARHYCQALPGSHRHEIYRIPLDSYSFFKIACQIWDFNGIAAENGLERGSLTDLRGPEANVSAFRSFLFFDPEEVQEPSSELHGTL